MKDVLVSQSVDGGGWNQSRTFCTRIVRGIKTVVMGKGKELKDMQARDLST